MQDKTGSYFLGFFVLAGVLTMMLALGGIIALLSVSVGWALSIIIPIADAIIIVFGILLLLNINPFKSLPQIQVPVLVASVCQRVHLWLVIRSDRIAVFGSAGGEHLCLVADRHGSVQQTEYLFLVRYGIWQSSPVVVVPLRRGTTLDHAPICDACPLDQHCQRIVVGGSGYL
ncbi:MAG: hypothetical protein MZV64_59185 [Ignavibacteriales bacterium]|nr:hypothetical protein [Ignavibacteriales bacterium]